MKKNIHILSTLFILFTLSITGMIGTGCSDNANWVILPDTIPVATRFEKMYIVGDATPGGWSPTSAQMTLAAGTMNTYVWEGELTKGAMKISCDGQEDWNGAWFLANEDGDPLEVGKKISMRFSASGDGGKDYKWAISAENAGRYRLTVNAIEETLMAEKLQ